jgi:hypothetical protein
MLSVVLQGSVQLLKKGSFNRCSNSGLACITLAKHSDVERCCDVMDGKAIYGRPMIIRKDKFVSDDPAYDCSTAEAHEDRTAAAAAAGGNTATAAAAGSALAAVHHVKGTAGKAKQQAQAPTRCTAAAVVSAAATDSRTTSSAQGGSAVRFVA